MRQDSLGLPPEIADRFMKPFAPFLKIEAASGAMLLVAACAALILSNSAWSTPFLAFWEMPIGLHFGSLDFTRSLRHWVNDGLMTLFFFVVALELERELVLGELRNLRAAALPFAGAARIGIRSVPFYFLLGGVIWLCFDASGIHPTIAGVILALMTPTYGWIGDERLRAILGRVLSHPRGDQWGEDTTSRRDLRRAGTAATEALSPVVRLEMMPHPWVGFAIMPIFALANAGVKFSGGDVGQPVSVAIFAGLVFGKPIGVLVMSWFAVRMRIATRAFELSWSLLAGGGLLTGIGFTMSLFIAGLAFTPAMLDAAKIGILGASVVSAVAGLVVLIGLSSRNRTA